MCLVAFPPTADDWVSAILQPWAKHLPCIKLSWRTYKLCCRTDYLLSCAAREARWYTACDKVKPSPAVMTSCRRSSNSGGRCVFNPSLHQAFSEAWQKSKKGEWFRRLWHKCKHTETCISTTKKVLSYFLPFHSKTFFFASTSNVCQP